MLGVTLAVLILSVILYDDLRYRSVRVVLFPLLGAVLVYMATRNNQPYTIGLQFVFNVAYVLMLLGVVYLYFRFRYNIGLSALAAYVGWGDVLFLLCIAVWFDPVSFILFNTISFILSLAMHYVLSYYFFRYASTKSIPLAGFQSFLFAFVLVFQIML